MNVLHINQSDISGGASIAGFRLHEGLLAEGVDSRLLVGDMTLEDERVAALPAPSFLDRQTSRVAWRMGLNYVNLTSSFAIRKHPFYKRADILNLHNLHGGYFNYLSVRSLTEIKPAVFTLHDMWSFTGHCAYSYDCGGWERGCGQCPYLSTTPPVKRDSTRLEWRLKNWVYNGSNLEIVAPSRWLAEQARRSLLKRFPVHHIPYGLDLKIYRPLDADQSRRELGIPAGKKVLMFGAQMLSDQRKGGDLLLEALQGLPASLKSGIVLLTLGQGGEALAATTGMRTIHLGYLSGDAQKVRAYSAADLFIFPTRADNLPLMLQESMACGTPMVSFNIGGVPDMVRPGQTGYLARDGDALDLRDGIMQLLEDERLLAEMGQRARAIALDEYSLELQASRYLEVYRRMLSK